MSRLMQFCCALLLLCFPMMALADPPDKDKGKPPRVTLNENDTPLDQLIEKVKTRINEKVEYEKTHGNTDCINAEGIPDDEEKPKNKAKACKVMQFKGEHKIKDPVEVKENANKKIVSKKVKTRTTLVVGHPKDLTGNDASRWDDLNQLKYDQRPPKLEFAGLPPNAGLGSQAANLRIRNAKLPGSEAINNDKDCIDTATGQHLGGWVHSEQGDYIDYACFEDTSALKLKKTLILREGGSGEYVHANGKIYTAKEAEDLGYTTLEELIDEDGTPGLDQDHDGFFGEDPPELDNPQNSLCKKNGGEPVAGVTGESCDFSKEVRRRANEQAKLDKPHGKQKIFKVNENGECDPNADGEYACGEEPREIEIEETMELSCPPGGWFEDDRCVIPPKEKQGQMALAYAVNAEGSDTVVDYAMMGFTFAPPVLKWGINEVERVCIFGWCFEIFALRFGYEFEVAAGLRLPVEVKVTDIPSPRVVVEQDRTLTANLKAMDFKVQDYIDFCNKHELDRSWYISDCERFAFPEYFDSMLPDSFFPGGAAGRQGQEFVAQTTVFAGLVIRILSIPVVNFGVDSAVNVPAMCTLKQLQNQFDGIAGIAELLANFGKSAADGQNLMTALRDNLANCASFTTPWGYDEKGKAREFPFLQTGFDIPADCLTAKMKAVAVGGDPKPICSGLSVNIYGATLGLGLELVPKATSKLITAKATTSGDAEALDKSLQFEWDKANPTIPVKFDNFDRNIVGDDAMIYLNDWVYYLNTLEVTLNGKIELGGLLAFIGNVATFPLVTISFSLDPSIGGIPIGQHPGTGPVTIKVPVSNYALTVDAKPRPDDPKRVNDQVLKVMPGTSGIFEVWVKNEGSVPDTMDNFNYEMSNRPQSSGPYVFGIYANTDFDCVDGSGKLFWGYPFDNIADDCYDALGNVRADRTEVTADDSVDVWHASLGATSAQNVPAHSVAGTPVWLTVTPYRHPLTKPGDYPVRFTADSRTARELKLQTPDPSKFPRLGAEDVVLMRIESFFEPEMTVTPVEAAVKPRGSVTYTVQAANYGNDSDRFAMQAVFADSNTATPRCSLTTMGSGPACPYRAQITRIDPAAWTSVAELDTFFPMDGYFQPLQNQQDTFSIRAPLDWPGMQDTIYQFTLTATSTMDPAITKAKKEKTVQFKCWPPRKA